MLIFPYLSRLIIFDEFKKIDFLINVVGINKKIQEIELSEWEEVIKTNLTSIFYVTKQCISKMDQGSRIVNVSSIAEEIEV